MTIPAPISLVPPWTWPVRARLGRRSRSSRQMRSRYLINCIDIGQVVLQMGRHRVPMVLPGDDMVVLCR